ncbi:hypothetical protein FV242_20530 [Methylobacterium sp. WL64]|uniref:hypothetical protein n=1 Tax=Methylobacterium sp. WL64 TaxID=2603894 RepID=UPI0011CCAD2B|nr:hypothetical protein [Methylobacterium sp. WL64]TXN00894.1 hypothetical protein FV242_20530 [Methylobacterium sp. WL64]
MGLSEQDIEARLSALRRQREAIDREIADLVLYLELGRRLSGAQGGPAVADPGRGDGPDRAVQPPLRQAPAARAAAAETGRSDIAQPSARPAWTDLEDAEAGPVGLQAVPQRREPQSLEPRRLEPEAGPNGIPPAIAFTEDAAGARRYGRALVEAACGAILAAGRPLHAGEILEILLARGFTLPGRDPVAALNTRLWKRSGPGGPLLRVAEATYALAGLEAGAGMARPVRGYDPDA